MEIIYNFNLMYFLEKLYYSQNNVERVLTNFTILVIMTTLVYWFMWIFETKSLISSNIWIIIYAVFRSVNTNEFKNLIVSAFIIHFVINILITLIKGRKQIAQIDNNVNNNDSDRNLDTIQTRKRNKK